jgi:hypothetical protein
MYIEDQWYQEVTEDLLVPEPSPFHVDIAIAQLKMHKSPGRDQIQA